MRVIYQFFFALFLISGASIVIASEATISNQKTISARLIPCEIVAQSADEKMTTRAGCDGGSAPGTPSSISVPSSNTTGNYTVSWGTASSGYATRYELEQNKSGTTLWSQVYSGHLRSKAISMPFNGSYRYRVKACNTDGCSGYRYSGYVVVNTTPTTPSYVSYPATNTSGDYSVSWGSSSGVVTSYRLEQKVGSGSWSQVYSGTARSKAFSGKASNTYQYRVRACGSVCSSYRTTTTVLTVLRPPTSITTPGSSSGSYTVSWASVNVATSYRLEEQINGGGWNQVYSGTALSKSFTKSDAGYRYRVKACTSATCSGYKTSNTITVVNLPSMPSSISGPSNNANGNFTINWGAASGVVTSYTLQRRVNSGSYSTVYSGSGLSKSFSGLSDGSYDFQVRACNGSGCSSWRGPHSVFVNVVRTDPLPAPAPHVEPIPAVDSTSEKVGATSGEFRIDESGALNYSIPIAVAPGTAGIAPQLRISYNSNGGNGYLGVGWALSGQSAITRCRKTHEQDGESNAVSLTNNDRFCLDGQRLILVSGNYGEDGAEYKTEIDTNSRIRSYGIQSGGPQYFKVWSKDGSIRTYGETEDSRIEVSHAGSAPVYVWAVNRMQDNVGNYMDYEYFEDNYQQREFYLKFIRYTGNTDAGLVPYNHVEFVYEDGREDTVKSYVYGYERQMTKRLQRIDSYDHNQIIRSYHLGYSDSYPNYRSLLMTLQQCVDAVKSSCLPYTTFSWQQKYFNSFYSTQSSGGADYLNALPMDVNGDGLMDLTYLKKSGSYYRIYTDFSNGNGFDAQTMSATSITSNSTDADLAARSMRVVDFNGDGRHDLMYIRKYSTLSGHSSYYRWAVMLSFGTRLSVHANVQIDANISINNSADVIKQTHFADFDGDGMGDFLYVKNNQLLLKRTKVDGATHPVQTLSTQTLSTSATSTSVTRTEYPAPADFNGDGKLDLILKVKRIYSSGGGGGGGDCDDIIPRTADVVSTQKIAPCPLKIQANSSTTVDHAWKVFYSNGTNSLSEQPVSVGLVNYVDLDDLKFADINSDGLTDLISFTNCTTSETAECWRVSMNNGRSFTGYYGDKISGVENSRHMRLLDLNGDGYLDILYPTSTRWKAFIWNYGTDNDRYPDTPYSVSFTHSTSNYNPEEDFNFFMDINGDGQIDRLYVDNSANNRYWKRSQGITRAHQKIDTIINGYGARTEVVYKPMTDESIYTKDYAGWGSSQCWGNCSPVMEYVAPLYVVSEAKTRIPTANPSSPGSVDQSAYSRVAYRYAGAKIQGGGRGFLGFRQLISTDSQTGIETKTTYRQDFPFTGMPKTTEVRKTSGGSLISYSTNTWESVNVAANGRVVRPQLTSATDTQYNVDSSSSSALMSKTITNNWYDTNGNSTRTQVKNYDANNQWIAEKDTVNQYQDNLSRWHLGRLTQTSVTHKKSGHSNRTLTSTFEYDAVTGMLTKTIVEPNRTDKETLVTAYQYDAYGNRLRTTVCSRHYLSTCGTTTAQDDNNPYTINRHSRVTYDSEGRYVLNSYNGLGHLQSETLSYSPYGETQVRTLGQVVSDTRYDGFGVPYFSRSQIGGYNHVTKRFCSQLSDCPTGAKFRIENVTSGGTVSRIYKDLVERTIRTANQGFDGRWIYVDVEYDNLSREVRKSEPYYDGEAIYWTEFTYDIYGRLTQTTFPDGSTASNSYQGFTTILYNGLGQAKTEIKNALGQTTRVIDNLGGTIDYEYNVLGSLTKTIDSVGNQVQINYDHRGRKVGLNDPDKGNWTYQYNANGELAQQNDAKGQKQYFYYDALGRVVKRVEKDSNNVTKVHAEWVFDTAQNGLTKLAIERDLISGYYKELYYDSFGRISSSSMVVDGNGFDEDVTYDQFGRTYQQFDASGDNRGVRHIYNQYGYLQELVEELTDASYHKILAMDARGNTTQIRYGNGLTSYRSYQATTGRLQSINTGSSGLIQDLRYQFDAIGNLTQRKELSGSKNLLESFSYDGLNRLTQANHNNGTQTFTYDAVGNITYKSDVGSYTYGQNGAGPHAVTQTNGAGGTQSYSYDANGNMVSGGGKTISYSTFDKPLQIVKGGHTSQFKYSPGNNRYKRVDIDSNGTTTRYYLGGLEVIHNSDGTKELRRNLGGTLISYNYNSSNNLTTTSTRYLHTDNLGSIDVITDENGAIVQEQSFDAFGKRRSAANWSSLNATGLATYNVHQLVTNLGYTGHEQLDEVGLIHMNGRIYDPSLGRFLQADPHIQSPSNTQSLNRYSYVLNNPLSYTDPSGYFFKSIGKFFKKFWRTIASIAIVVVAAVVAAALTPVSGGFSWAAFGVAVGGGFLSGAVATGTLKGALFGAFSAAVTFGIGSAFSSIAKAATKSLGFAFHAAKATVHGLASGTISVLQGGKFGHGFISAGMSSLAGGYIDAIGGKGNWASVGNRAIRITASAAVGGTSSALTGGKFANGAVSGAFNRAFNDELHFQTASAQKKKSWKQGKLRRAALKLYRKTTQTGNEWGAAIYEKNGKYKIKYFEGTPGHVDIELNGNLGNGWKVSGWMHSHPGLGGTTNAAIGNHPSTGTVGASNDVANYQQALKSFPNLNAYLVGPDTISQFGRTGNIMDSYAVPKRLIEARDAAALGNLLGN
ncbi:FG-GAP-like repeat-containing protein [Aliikangiella coralliicola]|uniref:Fibronectin type-III domain-containing protein n=1 Tax=Aliikangiella coralliicola TaxID=2592383 RepID=A0A545UJG0_9GAMM|nr:FG-GAP-like repeat-containing protein [Aliikangiella coralliicola]TQV89601.1 hypothetical protein FLL46_01585 [Aliikangiella coralliicola]